MLKRLAIFGVFIGVTLLSAYAFAQEQPKDFILTVNQADLQVLSAGLGKLPYEAVAPLMVKLQAQVVKQQAPADAPKAEQPK